MHFIEYKINSPHVLYHSVSTYGHCHGYYLLLNSMQINIFHFGIGIVCVSDSRYIRRRRVIRTSGWRIHIAAFHSISLFSVGFCLCFCVERRFSFDSWLGTAAMRHFGIMYLYFFGLFLTIYAWNFKCIDCVCAVNAARENLLSTLDTINVRSETNQCDKNGSERLTMTTRLVQWNGHSDNTTTCYASTHHHQHQHCSESWHHHLNNHQKVSHDDSKNRKTFSHSSVVLSWFGTFFVSAHPQWTITYDWHSINWERGRREHRMKAK